MIYHTFSFANLPAHELMPHLASFLERHSHCKLSWHLCWLSNESQPVIGLLPIKAWTAYTSSQIDSALKIEVLKTSRHIELNKTKAHPYDNSTPNHGSIHSNNFNAEHISNEHVSYHLTYNEWIEELISYCNDNQIQNNDLDFDCQQSTTFPSYQNGLIGFIGYDIGAKALAPNTDIAMADQPSAFLAHYDIYLKPAKSQGWALHINSNTSKIVKDTVLYYLQLFDEQLLDLIKQSNLSPALPLKALWNLEQYTQAFNQTQNYLYQGDSYQINLTQKWQGKLESVTNDLFSKVNDIQNPKLIDYLPQLQQKTMAPFAGYLGVSKTITALSPKSGFEFELLSCSPELFVAFDRNEQGQQKIITKPIKGTLPRGSSAEHDEQLKNKLVNSEKDKAENVMIVDLLRNDLGKYAEIGSVKVPKIFAIESFSNVHHMVSTITATIKKHHHPLTVLFNSLPAGSITGTPKKRAVEIISELEVAPRGAYCGTLGYINFDGTGQWNVLIRSLQSNSKGEVALWAGGGITVGSKCNAEYQECQDKVGNLLAVLSPKE
ncbi:anthranilate synthase component I family protein [Psychrobacter sp.]|uniref:anthranilate synthase component I family protein n=1 Tax=Psychrobacter sp. TaxID=56811 RepID=UPI0025FB5FDD|nr:anthranilate synthase component I family protein [Psychrobacter sp.]